jgi:hypothetical protein
METLTTPSETTKVQKVTTRTVAVQDVQAKISPDVSVPGAGNVTSTFVIAGSSGTQELILTITNLHLTTGSPATVICQPRQSVNQNFNFPDIFGVQVVTTAANQMVVRIRRLDANSGWGQDLRLDLLIFDNIHNP